MTGQQTLDGRPPADAGLWRKVITGNHIDHHAWLRAHASHEYVGTCRTCGDYLTPQPPDNGDYTARCRSCSKEIQAPGGRVLRHTSRKSDQPKG